MMSSTKVPDAFKPLFELAEKHVGDYFKHRKYQPEKGMIEISGSRYIMLRGASISVEFFQLSRKLFGSENLQQADLFAAGFLYELAHLIGNSDARLFHKKMKLTDPVEKLSAGPVHFAHTGWAFVNILDESKPSPNSDYFLVYKHPYSFECDAWLNSSLAPTYPVCVMNAGYSSGWCQESFGISLDAREVTCRSLGHDDCLFIMAPPDRLDKRIAEYLVNHQELPDLKDSFQLTQTRIQLEAGETNQHNILTKLLSNRLFTYARNLEATQQSLPEKIELLNKEIEVRKETEHALAVSEKSWRELSEISFDSILRCRMDCVIEANKASETLFKRSASSLINQSIAELLGLENWVKLKLIIDTDHNNRTELKIDINGRPSNIEVQINKTNDNQFVLAFRDISERVNTMNKLERLANYDSLTGLCNRTAFERIVTRKITNSSFDKDKHALLYFDLDKFKQVNDTLGHKAGDLLLYEVAQRAGKAIRALDLLARMGGDEFTIWLPDIRQAEEAQQAAKHIMESMTSPFLIENQSLAVLISIGIAFYPEDGLDYETLYLHADQAMYEAKSRGGGAVRTYKPN